LTAIFVKMNFGKMLVKQIVGAVAAEVTLLIRDGLVTDGGRFSSGA
jgi:hypothetical protein